MPRLPGFLLQIRKTTKAKEIKHPRRGLLSKLIYVPIDFTAWADHTPRFENTDEARKVVARNDIIIKGYPAFLKVPRKYYNPDFVPQLHYSKPRGVVPQAPSPWSPERARIPSHSDYPTAQLHGFGPIQAFGSEPPFYGGFHGNNFQTYPPSSGGIPPKGGYADSSDGPPLVSGSSTPGKKKSSKKKSKNRKVSEPVHPKAMVHQASSNTKPVRTTNDAFPNSDQVDSSNATMIHPSANLPQDLQDAHLPTGEVDNVSSYTQGTPRSASPAQPTNKMTSYATVAEKAVWAGLDKSKDTQQPDNLPGLRGGMELETIKPVSDSSGNRTPGALSLHKSSHSGGEGELVIAAEKTPLRPVAHAPEKEVTPPRSGEDVDESFQTAVETPESARSTLVAEPGLKSYKGDSCAYAEQIAKSAVGGSDSSPSAKIDVVSHEPHVSDVDSSEATMSSCDAKARPGLTGGAITSFTASKACEAIKTGPSKTESLSPFARPVQQQRKLKKKSQKKDRKNGRSESSGGKDHHGAVSSVSADDEVLSSSTIEDAVLPQSRPMSAPDCDDTELVQPAQPAPAKSLLNRLLFGGRQKNDDSPATKPVVNQHSVLESVGVPLSESELITGEDRSHVEPTLTDSGSAVAEPCINIAPKTDDTPPIGIDRLSISRSNFPSDTGTESHLAPMQEADSEVANPTENAKKQKKKKKKSNKRKGATLQPLHTDQPTSAVHDEDASSTGTMQAHTPEGSRSASVEPQIHLAQGWKGIDLSNLTEKYERFESSHSAADGNQKSSESWLSSSSTEHCLTVLKSMVTEDMDSTCEIATDELSKNQGDIQRSMHKIKQLEHEERVRRLTAKSDLKGAEAEENKWAKYLDGCQNNQLD
ncbi:hypothetical protein BDV97DRAFT_209061 [Delphinella strobiligena]|nr:hypothetical protein BDV97DRAFT_209061 [Delphinella strobiligena]